MTGLLLVFKGDSEHGLPFAHVRFVMAGLVPPIHDFSRAACPIVDARHFGRA
jgi:hypothetical protein